MKNVIISLLICFLIFGGWKYYQVNRECNQLKKAKVEVSNNIQSEAKEISRKVDEKGIESVLYDVTKNKRSVDKIPSGNLASNGIIDTTSMALDIRTKQLTQIKVINASLEAENIKLKQQIDANKRPFYTYSGNGLNLKFTPPYNDQDTIQEATADFLANIKIKDTQYWKRKWFLGSKRSYLAITSDSKYFKINGADFVEFEQKHPFFGLRIQANSNYNPQTGSIGFGPAVRIDLGRFSIQGNYTYYPASERWRPIINGNYDIIRF